MGNRTYTEFEVTREFDEGLNDLEQRDPVRYGQVLAKMEKFEGEYKASNSDSELSRGFEAKQIDNQPGEYQLKQVELTHDFRASIIFPDGRIDAWWSDRWKKTRQRNEREIKAARKRARRQWDIEIEGAQP